MAIPNMIQKWVFGLTRKALQLKDRKWVSIKSIQTHLRSFNCRSLASSKCPFLSHGRYNRVKLKMLFLGLLVLMGGCIPIRMPNYVAWRPYEAEYDYQELYDRACFNENKPLTLCEAIDLAMEYNLDIRMQELEKELESESIIVQRLKMLPQLNINGEYSERNNSPAYSSKPINGGPTSIPSASSERDNKTINENLVWSYLNFGLAYMRARREMHQGVMLEQRHRRARQNLVLDIFRAYYRALIAQKALQKAKQFIDMLDERERVLSLQIQKQLIPQLEALVNKDQLIDMRTRLYAFQNEERSALIELKGLLGLAPGRQLRLAESNVVDVNVELPSITQLEKDALTYRPELLSQDVKIQVDAEDVHTAMHQMYPDISLYFGNFNDGNKFLLFNSWMVIGSRIAYDLLSLPSKAHEAKQNMKQRIVDQQLRLSMSMGVLTQLHLAYINVDETREQYHLAKEQYRLKKEILVGVERLFKWGKANPSDVLIREVEALFAEVNEYKSYANVLISLEQLDNALGQPLRFSGDEIACHHLEVQEDWEEYCRIWSVPPVEYPEDCCEEPEGETEWIDDPY